MLPLLLTGALAAGAAISNAAGDSLAPPFRIPSARELRFIELREFAGDVLYLEIARSTCPQSAAEAPALIELRNKYKSRGFEVLTVYDELAADGGDPFARALADATRKGYVHPIAVNDGGEFHEGYYKNIQATPSAFLISRGGRLTALGASPLADSNIVATRAKIEECLGEAIGNGERAAAAKSERAALEPFSLLLYSGGLLRSAELAGRPTLLAALAPGQSMDRVAPALERAQKLAGNRARVIAVVYSDFEPASVAGSACPNVSLAAPDARARAAIGARELPQFLFLDAHGKIAKRVTALYGAYGIEGAVIERTLQCLIAEAAPGDAGLRERFVVYDDKNQVSYLLPSAFSATASAGASDREFVASRDAGGPRKTRVVSRIVTGGADAMSSARAAAAKAKKNYVVDSEERLPNGATLLSESWQDSDVPMRGLRIFVPTSKGVLELEAGGPLADFNAHATQLRSTAESILVGK
jgi:hypothetical protein